MIAVIAIKAFLLVIDKSMNNFGHATFSSNVNKAEMLFPAVMLLVLCLLGGDCVLSSEQQNLLVE